MSPDDRRPSICFVLPSLAGGGAERVAVQVLNALDPARWDRSLYLFDRSGPYLGDVSPAVRLEAGEGRARFAEWGALRNFIRRARPDLVVAFLSYVSVVTAARAAGVGTRVVFDIQTPVSAFLEDADYHWSRPWHRRLFTAAMRRACALADAIVATSRGVADDLLASCGADQRRLSVVPNPVDVASIERAAAEPIDPAFAALWRRPVIVAAGRLAEAKNYPLLVRAFAILRRSTAASLFILGAGDGEAALRRTIADCGVQDDVHLCGFQRNPWQFMAQADVFALSSHYEGFGNVVVEAMACGVPVVATSSPGTRDIVSDGVDGFLVDSHEPDPFAAALAKLVTDGALRARLSAAALAKARRYDTATVAACYDRVLAGVLA